VPFQHTCPQCDKEFSSRARNGKYCSRECQTEARQSLPRICPQCGKEFAGHDKKGRKYCSPQCATESRHRYRSTVCQRCGKEFNTGKKTRKYCGQQCSAESQRRPTRTCAHCGKTIPSYRKFCSHKCSTDAHKSLKPRICIVCQKEYRPAHFAQKFCSSKCQGITTRKPIPKRTCKHCGQPFYSRDKRQRFCSKECFYAQNARDPITCVYCGTLFQPTHSKSKFCSPLCVRLGQKRFYGKGNHFWKGGHSQSPYYGPNWNLQRDRALARDNYTCQRCRAILDSPDLDVHHIRPRVDFHGDWLSANKMDNLISFCHSCHRKVEQGASITLSAIPQ